MLIYLLLAEHDVEIVADRGIHLRVGGGWEPICREMEAAFRAGRFEDGVVRGVRAERSRPRVARVGLVVIRPRSLHARGVVGDARRGNGAHVRRHRAALSQHLVERDSSRDRDVERAHVPEHRQRHDVVATLAHQAPDAAPLAAHDQRQRSLVVDLVPALAARGVEADHPHAARLERLERLREVGDARHADVFERASRGAAHHFGQAGRTPLGQQHAVGAGRLARAQDRAQVARVLDPVERHQQRRVAQAAEQVLDLEQRLLRDDGDDALVRHAARQPVERLAPLEAQRHAQAAGARDGVGDALVAQSLDHQEAVEVARGRAQRFEHGVDAADEVHVCTSLEVSKTTAWAAMPSPRPRAPRPSVLLALTDTCFTSMARRSARLRRMASR